MDSSPHFSQEYIDADKSAPLFKLCIALIVLETFFMGLFLISRFVNKTLKGLDIWLMLFGYAASLTSCIISFLFISLGGAGRHIAVVLAEDPNKFVIWLKIELAIQFTWILGITCPKLAILLLYLRIFTKRAYRRMTLGVIVFVSAIGLAFIIVPFAVCVPFSYNWDKEIPGGRCGDQYLVFKLASIFNIASDVLIMALPVPMVWNLNASLARKIGLTITFLAGSFGIVIGIFHAYCFFGVDLSDPTYNCIPAMIWTIAEPGAYLIAATLIHLRSLWRYVKQTQAFNTLYPALTNFSDRTKTPDLKSSFSTDSDVLQSEKADNHILVMNTYSVETFSHDTQSRRESHC